MRKKILWAIGMVAAVTLAAAWLRLLFPPANSSRPYLAINGQAVALEIADTPAEQAQGLSGHAPMTENQGMLFIFPDYQVRTFWMKDMLFPLDIIWIRDGEIVGMSENLAPEGGAPAKIYSSGAPANYVLEVNAGWAARHGVKTGDSIDYGL